MTEATPIAVGRLMAALSEVDRGRFLPAGPLTDCPIELPPQTYVSTSGEASLLLAFPSAAVAKARNRDRTGTSYEKLAVACLGGDPLSSVAGWLERDNVLIRVRNSDGETARVVADVLDRLSAAEGAGR